jgi:hypothetical protein
VDNLQRVRPGAPVKAIPAAPSQAPATISAR